MSNVEQVLKASETTLTDAYAKLVANNDTKSLLKKNLTPEIFEQLKDVKTATGATLLNVINSGCQNPGSHVGVYAPDSEAYTAFAPLFDRVIEDYHSFPATAQHPALHYGNPDDLAPVDPEGKYVLSIRVRCARNLDGYGMHGAVSAEQYAEIQSKIAAALESFKGSELQGTFRRLGDISEEEQQQLIASHLLFEQGDKYLAAAGACDSWPIGRGFFQSDSKDFLLWCCEEDHLRIIAMKKGQDLVGVYRMWVKAVSALDEKVKFARHPRLGYTAFCPTNLGTGLRASVHAKFPKLARDMTTFRATAKSLGLQIRGSGGENSDCKDGIFDVSNSQRLGLTEFEAVSIMCNGINKLIELEEAAPEIAAPAAVAPAATAAQEA